ncbi:hypothetical protein Sste5346_009272 [Sporothrix stenoceras]|uniref:Uncharacterized protein n=1 Tax=Sporothrix stenoceras TaxID=5173 RepID=A0ABR3YL19_9PEZI
MFLNNQVIDWDKFTPLAGYASNNSARVCFRPLQKKLNAFVESMADLGENTDNVTDTKAPTTPAPVKKTSIPGSKGRGRPKKRKCTETEGDVANGDGGDASGVSGTAVKEEPAASQPEPEVKKIKLEDMSFVEPLCEEKEQSAGSGQPAATFDTGLSTGVPLAAKGPQAAELSRECQGLYDSRAGDLSFDFGEYVHHEAYE